MTEAMTQMISYIEKIQEVDTKGIEPLVTIGDTCNVLREDEPRTEECAWNWQCNAPQIAEGGIVVPKTIGQE